MREFICTREITAIQCANSHKIINYPLISNYFVILIKPKFTEYSL